MTEPEPRSFPDDHRFLVRVLEIFSMSHADAYGDVFWRVDDSELTLYANVSDVFAWGGSDAEPITPKTLDALERAYKDLKAVEAEEFTAELYAARQRGMRPQGAAYPTQTHESWRQVSALYDACGPERAVGFGNPKPAPDRAAAGPAPATNRAALVELGAQAIWAQYSDAEPSRTGLVMANPHAAADAVLAVVPETARLHDEILTLQAELAKVRGLLRTENQRGNDAIDREETAETDALEQRQEVRRLGLMVDEYGAGASALTGKLKQLRDIGHRLAAHAVGFQDVLDESDRGPWGKTVGADIAELCEVLDAPAAPVLPASTDRSAVLREAADGFDAHAEKLLSGINDKAVFVAKALQHQAAVWREAAETLRRMADETPQQPEAPDCDVEFEGGGHCSKPAGHRTLANQDPHTPVVAQAPVRCTASVLRKPHGPHGWEPQPGMDPIRCPGFCCCDHPDAEHSVYGCADGCPCEYMPAVPAAVAQPDEEAATPDPDVVAYRSNGGRLLRCIAHAPEWAAILCGDFHPVTSEDLPDGGICTYPDCGADVLITQQPDEEA